MRMKPMPSQDMLDRLLRYDAHTGKLYWMDRPATMFSDGKQSAAHNAAIWNGKNAGNEAFVTALITGHRYASINKVKYLAHRVIWKLIYDQEPDVIDHIDGNPSNNRLDNLRSVGQTLNARNGKMRKSNTSGYNGVNFDKRRGHWTARVMVNRKYVWLGSFPTAEDAAKAQRLASKRFGFHETHGLLRVANLTGG